jgi:hypothetical protein
VNNHKIAKNSKTTKAREKLSADLELLEFNRFLDACLTKLKNNQIILNPQSYTDKQAIYWIKFPLFVVFIVQIELSNVQKQEMRTIYLLLSIDVVS